MAMTRPLRQPLFRRRARPLLRRCARPLLRCRARSLLRRRARRVLSAFFMLRGGKPDEEVFDVSHLERMLRSGQSEDAYYYLQRFLGRVPAQSRNPLSDKLLLQVGLFKTLATVAGGGEGGAVLASMIEEGREDGEDMPESPFCARFHKIFAKMHADPRWASKIWQEIEPEQVTKIMDVVSRCPDLQGKVGLPRERILLWDSTTRGLCKCPSRRKKATNRVPLDVIVHEFLLHKRVLTTQGINGSVAAHSENLSSHSNSHSAMPHTEMEKVSVQPAVPEGTAPGVDATVVAGKLGGDGNIGNRAGFGASK